MQKILPDTSFLAQWRDKIEAVVITHGRVLRCAALCCVECGRAAALVAALLGTA